MLKIGITGSIGAGKSVIAHIFSILGAPVYDADTRAKILMSESENLRSAIKVLFGEESFEGSTLNRKHIASKAFHQPKLLSQLNELVHPAVREDFVTWVSNQTAPYIIKEAALLLETGSYLDLDEVLLVSASEATRLRRVQKRDPHRSIADINAIVSRQMSDEDKRKLTSLEIVNDGNDLILPQVISLHERFSTHVKA